MTADLVSPRRVLITGGGRGLGAAIGQDLASQGAIVGLLARTASEVSSTAESIVEFGGQAIALPCDVLDRTELEASVDRFREWAGGIDAIVCAAGGIDAIGPVVTVDMDAWKRDYETPVLGLIHTIRATLPTLKAGRNPSVSVLIGPGHQQGLTFGSAYAAAQAALVRLVETLSHELASDRVFLYAVNPGLVPTRMMNRLLDTPEGRRWLPQFTEAFAEGKEVPASVAARMVAWLIERRPSELNGRVVASMADPEFLETRLDRIIGDDLGVLRLR